MFNLSGPTIATSPVGTGWTCFTFWIVDTLFVWAADYSIGKRDTLGAVASNELQNLLKYDEIEPDVALDRVPALQMGRFLSFTQNDSDRHLRRSLVTRPVESDGRNRVSGEPALRLLAQCLDVALS
jgi:hypothetical protein